MHGPGWAVHPAPAPLPPSLWEPQSGAVGACSNDSTVGVHIDTATLATFEAKSQCRTVTLCCRAVVS